MCLLALHLLRPLGPGRPDEGEDIQHLVFGQNILEGGHAALEPGDTPCLQRGLPAIQRVLQQQRRIVVPCVAGYVMRRRGQEPTCPECRELI